MLGVAKIPRFLRENVNDTAVPEVPPTISVWSWLMFSVNDEQSSL